MILNYILFTNLLNKDLFERVLKDCKFLAVRIANNYIMFLLQ